MTNHIETFEQHRPRLFSIAYRMLGSVMEAEDAVQETYLRYIATDVEHIESHQAYLNTIVTRLCLDVLKSARVQREEYIGPWLPEPLVTANAPDELVDKHETITMAFLVLLESLSPVERAVFLLREVFDYGYDEIATVVEKSEVNCRQYYSRAKKYLSEQRPRFETPTPDKQTNLIMQFLNAVQGGDMDGLTAVLSEDVTLWSDGGGKVRAALLPILGREKVTRLFMAAPKQQPENLSFEFTELNGRASILMWTGDAIFAAAHFTTDEAQIQRIHIVWNPEKLQHLQKTGRSIE